MTRTRTSLSPVALLLVAGLAIGFLVAGIVRAAAQAEPSAKRRTVVIPLQLNATGEVIGVDQPVSDDQKSKGKEVGLSKGQGHFADWVTYPPWVDVNLTIGMKVNNPYPFEGPFQNDGNHVSSAKLLKDAKEGKYDYWVNVFDKKAKKNFKIDPPVRVDP